MSPARPGPAGDADEEDLLPLHRDHAARHPRALETDADGLLNGGSYRSERVVAPHSKFCQLIKASIALAAIGAMFLVGKAISGAYALSSLPTPPTAAPTWPWDDHASGTLSDPPTPAQEERQPPRATPGPAETSAPSEGPTAGQAAAPSVGPTLQPSEVGTDSPTPGPTIKPSKPETISPTPKPSEATSTPPQQPTLSPLIDNNAIQEGTVNPYVLANIKTKEVKAWHETYFGLVNALDGTDKNTNQAARDSYCEKRMKEEEKEIGTLEFFPKYAPDGTTPDDGLSFNIEEARKHLLAYSAMLCRYYKPLRDYCDLSAAIRPTPRFVPGTSKMEADAYDASLRIHAWKFAGKLVRSEPITIAVVGTSVMAGEDNCFTTTYSPVLERLMNSIFAPLGVLTSTRNAAQNGDGVSQTNLLLCADQVFDFDQVDFVHAFWSMTDNTPVELDEKIIRMWMSQDRLVLPYYHDSLTAWDRDRDPKFSEYWEFGAMQGIPESQRQNHRVNSYIPDIPGIPKLNPWWTEGHWGKRGIGRCWPRTREGWSPTFMQNWHPGPAGNEIYADRIVFFYIQAALAALEDISAARQAGADLLTKWAERPEPRLPAPHSFKCSANERDWASKCGKYSLTWPTWCVNGMESWNAKYNLTDYLVDPTKVPYPDIAVPKGEEAKWAWRHGQTKAPSSINHCQDLGKEKYRSMPECSSHNDIVFGYISQLGAESYPHRFITFKVGPLPSPRLVACTPSFKNRKSVMDKWNPADSGVLVNGKSLPTSSVASGPVHLDHASTCVVLTDEAPVGEEFLLSIAAPDDSHVSISSLLSF